MGTGEGLHSGPRPQSLVARGEAREGQCRRTHASGTALVLLLAGEGLETKHSSILYLPSCIQSTFRNRRGLQEGRQGHLA